MIFGFYIFDVIGEVPLTSKFSQRKVEVSKTTDLLAQSKPNVSKKIQISRVYDIGQLPSLDVYKCSSDKNSLESNSRKCLDGKVRMEITRSRPRPRYTYGIIRVSKSSSLSSSSSGEKRRESIIRFIRLPPDSHRLGSIRDEPCPGFDRISSDQLGLPESTRRAYVDLNSSTIWNQTEFNRTLENMR